MGNRSKELTVEERLARLEENAQDLRLRLNELVVELQIQINDLKIWKLTIEREADYTSYRRLINRSDEERAESQKQKNKGRG